MIQIVMQLDRHFKRYKKKNKNQVDKKTVQKKKGNRSGDDIVKISY